MVWKAALALAMYEHHARGDDGDQDLQQAEDLLERPGRRTRQRRPEERGRRPCGTRRTTREDVRRRCRRRRGSPGMRPGIDRTNPIRPAGAPWNHGERPPDSVRPRLRFSQTSCWPISFMNPPIQGVGGPRAQGRPVIGSLEPRIALSRS